MNFYFFFMRGKARGRFPARGGAGGMRGSENSRDGKGGGKRSRKIHGTEEEEEEKGTAGSIPAASRLEFEAEAVKQRLKGKKIE